MCDCTRYRCCFLVGSRPRSWLLHRSDLAVDQIARTMLDRTITELVEERNTVKGIS
jgi:hypothetical protein